MMVAWMMMSAINAGAQQLPTDGPLTINEKLQSLATRLLNNKQGSIIAIEPSTGRILCLVSHERIIDNINRAISKDYSPGSTFKTAQALTMITERELGRDTSYSCHKGFWQKNIHIGCHEHRSPLKLVQAIEQSCNSYFCKAFSKMMDDRKKYPTKIDAINKWAAYMYSMGLGHPLGVDIPGEIGGRVPDAAYLEKTTKGRWNGTTIMWVGMGQGEIRCTPLQLCNLAAIIANRGWYITPHIHAATKTHHLAEKYTEKRYSRPSQEAYDIVIEGMRACITSGTAANINTPHYKICGKTGTAENRGDDHSVFIGFAPMQDPKIAVSVYVENGGFGADLSAPMASLIMEQYLTGKLSPTSEAKAKKWERKTVKVTARQIPVNLDSL